MSGHDTNEQEISNLGFHDYDTAAYKGGFNPNDGAGEKNKLVPNRISSRDSILLNSTGTQLKIALSNVEFTLSMISSSLVICHYYAFTTLLPQLAGPYGFGSTKFNSKMGILYNFFGVSGGVVTALVLTCYPKKLSAASLCVALGTTATFVYFGFGTAHLNDET